MSMETAWVGVYWERAVLDRARSAYVADLARGVSDGLCKGSVSAKER